MSGLPKGWSLASIGDLCRLINGRPFKPTEWATDGLPIIRIQNLNSPNASFNFFSGELDPKHLVQPGELVFAWSGTPGTSFGAHVWNGPPAALNQHIFRVIFEPSAIDRDFFRYAITSKLQELIGRAQGGVGLAHVTKGKFEGTKVPLPPLPEQRRIVAKIEALMARSRAAREALADIPALLDRYRQSTLKGALRGDLTIEWRNTYRDQIEASRQLFRDIREERKERWQRKVQLKILPPIDSTHLDSLPESWEWCRMEEVGEVRLGRQRAPKHHQGLHMRPYLRVQNVFEDRLDLSDVMTMNWRVTSSPDGSSSILGQTKVG